MSNTNGTTGSIEVNEMSWAQKQAVEAAASGAAAVQKALEAMTPSVTEIVRFPWSSGQQYQLVIQKLKFSHLPEGAIEYLRLENSFAPEAFAYEQWTRADAIAVGTGKMVCPHCHGDCYIPRNFTGVVTKIKVTLPQPCLCTFNKLYLSRWLNPANVATDYRNVHLTNMATFHNHFKTFPLTTLQVNEEKLAKLIAAADTGSEEFPSKLGNLIATVKKYQYNCYLCVGPAGTGKTTLMLGMYHRAVREWAIQAHQKQDPTPAVWKVSATALAKQFREWELRDVGRDADTGAPTPPPEVTPNRVLAAVRAGYVPCLFIDELDKFKMNSEFQAKEFSAVIDTIQSNGGQVFASTNLGT